MTKAGAPGSTVFRDIGSGSLASSRDKEIPRPDSQVAGVAGSSTMTAGLANSLMSASRWGGYDGGIGSTAQPCRRIPRAAATQPMERSTCKPTRAPLAIPRAANVAATSFDLCRRSTYVIDFSPWTNAVASGVRATWPSNWTWSCRASSRIRGRLTRSSRADVRMTACGKVASREKVSTPSGCPKPMRRDAPPLRPPQLHERTRGSQPPLRIRPVLAVCQ